MRCVHSLILAVGMTVTFAGGAGAQVPATRPTTTAPATTSAATAPAATKPATSTAPATATAPATTAAALPPVATKPADPSKLDANGYIRQWLILAPIEFGDKYDAEEIDKDQITDEAKLTPKEGDKQKVKTEELKGAEYKTVEKELKWKKVVTTEYYFDINEMLLLDTSESVGGYAVAYLDVPEEMKGITFSLCSNDNGKIFLNGKSIYKYIGGRSISEDADVVEDLTLTKGVNVVIFKVWNDSNNWQGCIRLLKKDGKPVTGVTVKLAK
jgi:hypothetical protein